MINYENDKHLIEVLTGHVTYFKKENEMLRKIIKAITQKEKMKKKIKVKKLKYGHVIEMVDNTIKTVQYIEVNNIHTTVYYIERGCTHALSNEDIFVLIYD
jgi:divalent metal cation (Fe/Co/Zn/Cd) transporter